MLQFNHVYITPNHTKRMVARTKIEIIDDSSSAPKNSSGVEE